MNHFAICFDTATKHPSVLLMEIASLASFYISGKEILFHFDTIRIATTIKIQIIIAIFSSIPCFSNKTWIVPPTKHISSAK